jgi:hypothetical protein
MLVLGRRRGSDPDVFCDVVWKVNFRDDGMTRANAARPRI